MHYHAIAKEAVRYACLRANNAIAADASAGPDLRPGANDTARIDRRATLNAGSGMHESPRSRSTCVEQRGWPQCLRKQLLRNLDIRAVRIRDAQHTHTSW